MKVPFRCKIEDIPKLIDDIIYHLGLDFVKDGVGEEFLLYSMSYSFPFRLRRTRPIAIYRAPYSSLMLADIENIGFRALTCRVPDLRPYPVLDKQIVTCGLSGGVDESGLYIFYDIMLAYFTSYHPLVLVESGWEVTLSFDPYRITKGKMGRSPICLLRSDKILVTSLAIKEIIEELDEKIAEWVGVGVADLRRGRKALSKPVPVDKLDRIYESWGLGFRIDRAPSVRPFPLLIEDDKPINLTPYIAFECPFGTKLALFHDPARNLHFLCRLIDDNHVSNLTVSQHYFPLRSVLSFALAPFVYPYTQFMSVVVEDFSGSVTLSVGDDRENWTDYRIFLAGSFRRNGALGVSGFMQLIDMAEGFRLWRNVG